MSSLSTSKMPVINIRPAEQAPLEGTFGVDRLAFRYPLDQHTDQHLTYSRAGRRMLEGLRHQVHLKVTPAAGDRAAVLRVEFNPSRVLDPAGSSLANARDSRAAALAVVDELHSVGYVPAKTGMDIGLSRVDLTRDFSVADPELVVRSLARNRVKYARRQAMYIDKAGGGEGLRASVGGVNYNLYDKGPKHAKTAWTESHNLRFEAQISASQALTKAGLRSLEDLTDERILSVATQAWDRSTWDAAWNPTTPAEVVSRTAHETETKAAMLGLYHASCDRVRLGIPQRHALYGHLKACGLLTHHLTVKARPGTRRLDWVSGLEVDLQRP